MPSPRVMRALFRELITVGRTPRVPEPDLVMDDPEKVAAFTRAGREDGVMAPVYLFHCAQACEIIRPGDTVVDLGCGPATQLGMIARLNPDAEFIGVDYSDEMLTRARAHIEELGLGNVRFERSDMADLPFLEADSVDAVYSTMALHHLKDETHLDRTFSEVKRVLKRGGGVYLVDFARLKSKRSIDDFAYQYADRQPELFTLDYLYSLHAAFSVTDFRNSLEHHLGAWARIHKTFITPFMIAVKSPPRIIVNSAVRDALAEIRETLPPHHRVDVKDLCQWFGMGGLKSQVLT